MDIELDPQVILWLLVGGIAFFVLGMLFLFVTSALSRRSFIAGWTILLTGLASVSLSLIAGVLPQVRRPPLDQEAREWKERQVAQRVRAEAAESQLRAMKPVADQVERKIVEVDSLSRQLAEKSKETQDLDARYQAAVSELSRASESHTQLKKENTRLLTEIADKDKTITRMYARAILNSRQRRINTHAYRHQTSQLRIRVANLKDAFATAQRDLVRLNCRVQALEARSRGVNAEPTSCEPSAEAGLNYPFVESDWARPENDAALILTPLPNIEIVLGISGTHYRVQPNNGTVDDAFQYREVLPTFGSDSNIVDAALDHLVRKTQQALKFRRVLFLVKGDADLRTIVNTPKKGAADYITPRIVYSRNIRGYYVAPSSATPSPIPDPVRNDNLPTLRALHIADVLSAALRRAGLIALTLNIKVLHADPAGERRKITPEIVVVLQPL